MTIPLDDQTALLQAMAEALRELHSPVIADPDCEICQLLAQAGAQVRASGAQAVTDAMVMRSLDAWFNHKCWCADQSAWDNRRRMRAALDAAIEQRAAELSSTPAQSPPRSRS